MKMNMCVWFCVFHLVAIHLVTSSLRWGRNCYSQNMCFCDRNTARCLNNGKTLSVIPKLTWQKDIYHFFFTNNFLQTLTKDTFGNVSNYSIEVLDLSRNQINHISHDSFKALTKLASLFLSNNLIEEKCLEPMFHHMPATLTYLYLNGLGLSQLPSFAGLKDTRVTGIHLNHNNVSVLNHSVFHELSHLSTLILSHNRIASVELNDSDPLQILYLDHNSLTMFPVICKGEVSKKLRNLSLSTNNITLLKRDSFQCLSNLKGLTLARNPIAKIESNVFSSLVSLIFLDLSEMTEPLTLERYAFNNSNVMEITFSSPVSSFRSFDDDVLRYCNNLDILDLSNNTFPVTKPDFLSSILIGVNLSAFFCLNCSLTEIPRTLSDMSRLVILNLSENTIGSFHRSMFYKNTQLRALSLKDNLLKTFELTPSTYLGLMDIGVEGNPFHCECDLLWLKTKLMFKQSIFSDPGNCKCSSPQRFIGYKVVDVKTLNKKACSASSAVTVMCVVGIILFILLVLALVYNQRWRIRYSLTFGQRRSFHDEDETTPLLRYHAYVLYCDEDLAWVKNEVMPNLEDRGSLKLCIKQRDFNSCRHRVDNIVQCLGQSSQVLCCMSNNFCKDSGCQFELSLVQKRLVGHPENLFLVLLEDIEDRYMTQSLYTLLQRSTVLSWMAGDNVDFWRKLSDTFRTL